MELKDYVLVMVVAWVGVFLINRGLQMAGLSQYTA